MVRRSPTFPSSIALVAISALVWGCSASAQVDAAPTVAPPTTDTFVGRTWIEARAALRAGPSPDALERAHASVQAGPDASSYISLMALREWAPERYRAVPAARRASVLCAALRQLTFLNDWGHLAVEGATGEAMEAMGEAGEAALPCLTAALDDRRRAPFFGSEDATIADAYRRSDFAYRGILSILGEGAAFAQDPSVRERQIAALRQRLADR